MTNETKTDRQRRLARERQRAKRERDALRRAALGGTAQHGHIQER
ncbi:hypothetical protein [Pseudomonas aeruginosa]